MKKYLIAIYVCCCAVLCACSDDDKVPNIRPAAQGNFTDERDGITYGWIRIGDLEWMTSNLKYGTPYYEMTYGGTFENAQGSPQMFSMYDEGYQLIDYEPDFEKYGNLYTWEEANEACPEGWRLPTDKDWKNLEQALGMSQKEADSEDWRGEHVATLMTQGKEGLGFCLQLSGCAWQSASFGLDLHLNSVGECGYFWTATEEKNNGLEGITTVYFRKIFANRSTVYRGTCPLDKLMRVRCCRDTGK